MDINKIEKEWDRIKPQLDEVFNDIDIYDMERISHNFVESLEYLSSTYDESPFDLLKKISPLFPQEVRTLVEKYATQHLYPWLRDNEE